MADTLVLSPAERQRAATRQVIVDAAFRMMRDEPTVAFSHETVAARARVAPRTLYRHFPAQADLTLALWERIRDTAGIRWPHSEAEIVQSLRVTFDQFEEHAQLTRAVIAAAANIAHSVHGSAKGRAAFRLSLSAILTPLPREEGDRLVAGCVSMYSAPSWQMLRDRGQLSQHDACDAGAVALDAVLTSARTRAAITTHASTSETPCPP